MKQIKLQVSRRAVQDCTVNKCYGVLFSGGGRAFVQSENYVHNDPLSDLQDTPHHLVAFDGMTRMNRYSIFTGENLADCLCILVEKGISVFEFENEGDLCRWLAGDAQIPHISVDATGFTGDCEPVSRVNHYAWTLNGERGLVVGNDSGYCTIHRHPEVCPNLGFQPTIVDLITCLLKLGAEVFEFETDREMYKWLAKE